MTIGIFGGTFNPLHIGHLVMAQDVAFRHDLTKVLFVPSRIPPHKFNVISEQDRYRMVELAIADNPLFEISSIELDRQEISYTIDTIELLQRQYSKPLAFIIGSDNILDIPHWYNWQKLLKICRLLIGERPGAGIAAIDSLPVAADLRQRLREDFVAISTNAVSSTEIRRRCWQRQPIRYLVPDQVAEYIQSHELYRLETERPLC